MNEDLKPWYQSRAVAGGVIALLSAGAGLAGLVIDADTQGQLIDLFVVGATTIGGALAIFGRIKASKKIK